MADQLSVDKVQRKEVVSTTEAVGKTAHSAIQFEDNRPQAKKAAQLQSVISNSTNSKDKSTGLPSQLKAGVEQLSGQSLDDVKVHYNSNKPAQLNAHAYAQGTSIHIATGQEKHLPHEAWHVVQQKQGRVQPTTQLKSEVAINDSPQLEHEATVQGKRAESIGNEVTCNPSEIGTTTSSGRSGVYQLAGRGGRPRRRSRGQRKRGLSKRQQSRHVMNDKGRFLNELKQVLPAKDVKKVHGIVKGAIHNLLPNLLGISESARKEDAQSSGMFEHGVAAITFAQQLIIKWLTYHPGVADTPNFAKQVHAHLKGVINATPVTEEEQQGDDDDDDDEDGAHEDSLEEDDGDKAKKAPSEKTSDPRFLEARLKVKNEALNRQREYQVKVVTKKPGNKKDDVNFYDPDKHMYAEHAKTEHQRQEQLLNRLFPKETKAFLHEFFTEHFSGSFHFLKVLEIANEDHGEVNLKLLLEINQGLNRLNLYARVKERKDFLDALVAANILTEDQSERLYDGSIQPKEEDNSAYFSFSLFDSGNESGSDSEDSVGGVEEEHHPVVAVEEEDHSKLGELLKSEQETSGKLAAKAEKLRKETADRKAENAKKRESEIVAFLKDDKIAGLKAVFNGLAVHPFENTDRWSLEFLKVLDRVLNHGLSHGNLLEAYERLFAEKNWPPNNPHRTAFIERLGTANLLPGVDTEELLFGTKSEKQIYKDAIAGSWVTKDEIEIGRKLLGPRAFAGMVAKHLKSGNPSKLRGMIEHVQRNMGSLLVHQPKLTGSSMVIDTNLIDLLILKFSSLTKDQKKMRIDLLRIIRNKKIKDLRLANIVVAETHDKASLLGKKIHVKLGDWHQTLKVMGVPFHESRSSKKYDAVFQELENTGVGENKGNADRSMMADMYMAERAGNHKRDQPHFATGDEGILEKIGNAKGQFNPEHVGVAPIHIHEILRDKDSEKAEKLKKEESSQEASPYEKMLDYKMGNVGTVEDLINWVQAGGFNIAVVGGAVRDALRGEEVNDVDMKTNMSLGALSSLLKVHKVPHSVVQAINLIKAGTEPHVVDITTTKKTSDNLDDSDERDFSMNALRIEGQHLTRDNAAPHIDGPPGAIAHAKSGELHLIQKGNPSNKGLINRLIHEPQLLGRALKFIERGHQQYLKGNPKGDDVGKAAQGKYHLAAQVLDLIREPRNIIRILGPLTKGADAAGKKALFIKKSGFDTPTELINVMKRLNFPSQAIRMVIPDTLAGRYDQAGERLSFNRDVGPRNRAVVNPDQFNAKGAPRVKADKVTGEIYQYRVYAYADHHGSAEKEPLLIDVDYTEHGVKGHPSPHYHIYRIVDGKWKKNHSGFSRTGQKGVPPTRHSKEGLVYVGPMPWTWIPADTSKIGLDKTNQLKNTLTRACKKAGLSCRYNYRKKVFNVGNEINLHLNQLHDLTSQNLTPKFLMLIHNLVKSRDESGSKKEAHFDKADQSIREFTGGMKGKARLRFRSQLESVTSFLKVECKQKLTGYLNPKKFSDADKIRLYDLVNASIPKEQCELAAKFARKHAANVTTFVEKFEFFIASAEHKVSLSGVEDLHGRMTESTLSAVGRTKVLNKGEKVPETREAMEGLVKGKAETLSFQHGSAAVYHVLKHADLVLRKSGRKDGVLDIDKDDLTKLTADYLTFARNVVANGKLVRVEHDRGGAIGLPFKLGDELVFVRITASGNAYLLSYYAKDEVLSIRLALQFLGDKSKPSGTKGPVKRVFNTVFGPLVLNKVAGLGNCLYLAVIDSAKMGGQSVASLRIAASGELETNWDYYKGFVLNGHQPGALENAKRRIQQDRSWASSLGDLAPVLVANSFNRRIHILSASTGKLLYTVGRSGAGGPAINVFYSGNHYDAAVRQG